MNSELTASPPARGSFHWPWAIGLAVLAALLRAWSTRGELWFDEVWSLGMAVDAGSFTGVFTSLHNDNNHYLNTLYLRLVGPTASPWLCRLLSVCAGTATVAVASLRSPTQEPVARRLWALLLAVTFILVQYGSEARGYGPAVFFAVACFVLFERHLETGRMGWMVAFALCAGLGLLAHLTFVFVVLAFLSWAALGAILRDGARLRLVPALFLPSPLLVLVPLWFLDLRMLEVMGGHRLASLEIIRDLLRTTLGLPMGWAELAAVVALAAAAWQLWRLVRQRNAEVAFYVTLFAGLAATSLLSTGEKLVPRYFLLGVPFFLLLLARFLSWLAQGFRGGKWVSGLVVLGLIAGNLVMVVKLGLIGRGHYREAVAYMDRWSRSNPAVISSDHDFRSGVMIDYVSRGLPLAHQLAYLSNEDWENESPEWLVTHDFAATPDPPPQVYLVRGAGYQLAQTFPYFGLSGWNWYVYHRYE